jgi:hypothetical protein
MNRSKLRLMLKLTFERRVAAAQAEFPAEVGAMVFEGAVIGNGQRRDSTVDVL